MNNVTGSNLVECDQLVLKEMGIKKIGDRVRIFVAIKALRSKTGPTSRKRNRDSLAAMDRQQHTPYTPPSSSSPRHPPSATRGPQHQVVVNNRRWSQVVDGKVVGPADVRPSSPYAEADNFRHFPNQRAGGMSPITTQKKEQAPSYFGAGSLPSKNVGGRPGTPNQGLPRKNTMDSTVGRLINGQPVIRVIYNGGQTKVLDIKNCKILDDIILTVLKKLSLPMDMARNYCFWTLDGTGQDMNNSHRLTESELMRLCSEPFDKNERGRLILRKKHAGEPDEEELRKASSIALEEQNELHADAVRNNKPPSQEKIQKLTGKGLQMTLGSSKQILILPQVARIHMFVISSSLGRTARIAPTPSQNQRSRSILAAGLQASSLVKN